MYCILLTAKDRIEDKVNALDGGAGENVIFFDAWLYSPNPRRSKYEYMMQLEEILNSFACVR